MIYGFSMFFNILIVHRYVQLPEGICFVGGFGVDFGLVVGLVLELDQSLFQKNVVINGSSCYCSQLRTFRCRI